VRCPTQLPFVKRDGASGQIWPTSRYGRRECNCLPETGWIQVRVSFGTLLGTVKSSTNKIEEVGLLTVATEWCGVAYGLPLLITAGAQGTVVHGLFVDKKLGDNDVMLGDVEK